MSRTRSTFRSYRAALALLLLLVATSLLWSSEPGIKISVVAILASDRGNKIDPQLKNIAEEVQRRIDPKLTSFRLEKMCSKSVPIGGQDKFCLGHDQEALIAIDSKDDDGRIQLRVTPPLMGEITYQTTCGKYLPMITRFRTKKNELLLLAVCVQPCPGKK